jgi:thiamine-phosphate pyrophosphorylase
MTDAPADPLAIAASIHAAHAARFAGPPGAPPSAATGRLTGGGPVYVGAKEACLLLGFIDIDAECIARAWCSQTRRTGAFDARAWPDTPGDFGLRDAPVAERADAFAPCPPRLGLYAVLPDAAWVARMARAISA